MPVYDKSQQYVVNKAPYMIVVPNFSSNNPQVIQLDGEAFVFQNRMPTTLSMKYYEAVLKQNSGKEDGPLTIVVKDYPDIVPLELMRSFLPGAKEAEEEKTGVQKLKEAIIGSPSEGTETASPPALKKYPRRK